VCRLYARHPLGNTGLFGVLEVATGKITAGARHPHHTNVEFLALLHDRLRSAGLSKDPG